MVNKQEYENGLRCKGICTLCNDKMKCYQGQQSFNITKEVIQIRDNCKQIIDLLRKNDYIYDNEIVKNIQKNYKLKFYKPNENELKILNEIYDLRQEIRELCYKFN